MNIELVMFKADGSHRAFPLKAGNVIVGRAAGCDLRIPLASVSRKHCVFEVEDDAVTVRDLGSSNGTHHNGLRITEAELEPGDEITIGPVVFRVLVDGQPDDLEPVISVIPAHSRTDAEEPTSPQPSPTQALTNKN
ncbi:MAG: FHA domain-containing protein [Phycisphaeraceae bacterium]